MHTLVSNTSSNNRFATYQSIEMLQMSETNKFELDLGWGFGDLGFGVGITLLRWFRGIAGGGRPDRRWKRATGRMVRRRGDNHGGGEPPMSGDERCSG